VNQHLQPDEALVDLLVKQAVEGLSPQEQAVVDAATGTAAGREIREELSHFERAAAAIAMTRLDSQPLPEALRGRLLRDAANWAAGQQTQPVKMTDPQPTSGAQRPAPLRSGRSAANSGWWAAAACLVLALFMVVREPRPPAAPSTGQLRAQLLARTDSIRLSWSPTQDPGGNGVSGDLVWNPATQTGVMRFVGLSPNDRRARQYQLWIFDAERDERYPVDGGVFDVPSGTGEVLVPIHAAIAVRNPKLFAVTVEKPGGVVVSQREHIVVTAAPGSPG
jgi:hypothetical protein